jgi:AcrR family transcriptional regulator
VSGWLEKAWTMHPDVLPPDPRETAAPRLPVRANGRRRYDLLLDAAELLLEAGDGRPLTIQRLARAAGVPTASVYHFLPGPAAVSVALAQRYMAGFEEVLGRPIAGREAMGWRQIVARLIEQGFAFYRAHPYAQTLILGSDHSWAIRRSDFANNRRIAAGIAALLGDKFPDVPADALLEAVVVGMTINDAVFALSIADNGAITPGAAAEATVAVCAYLAAKFEPVPGRLD